VRHGRRADFAGDGLLPEIADGNVTPQITAKIQQHGVKTHHRMEKLRHVIVRFDLNGVGIPSQSQILGHEAAGELFPIHLRVSSQMGVVVADGAIDLAQQRHVHQLRPLPFQSIRDIGHLLAQRGRRGRLAMSARQHRLISILMRQSNQLGIMSIHPVRQQHLSPRFAQHQRIGQIVDVLGGAGEMDEFADRFQFGLADNSFSLSRYSTAFTSWLVVRSIFFTRWASASEKLLDQAVEELTSAFAQGRNLGNAGMASQRL
jgi:hypothetical protein